jgi:hypothetical protein
VGSAPAALESASHVLAFGLDVVHARTAPSQTFDTLGAGFSRAMLAATITALAAGAAAAGWAVHRDDLARHLRQYGELLAGTVPTYALSLQLVRGDGSAVPVRVTTSLARDPATEAPLHLITVVDLVPEAGAS